MRWSACNLGIFLGVLVARGIAEIVGMELRHHVHRRCGHVLSNPFQHRIGAALEVIGHRGWKKSSPHSATSAMLFVTVSQYQGVFASVIAHRPGTSVNTRPDRLPPSENIGVRRSSSANPNGRLSDQ